VELRTQICDVGFQRSHVDDGTRVSAVLMDGCLLVNKHVATT
jgi:hypothetical protein